MVTAHWVGSKSVFHIPHCSSNPPSFWGNSPLSTQMSRNSRHIYILHVVQERRAKSKHTTKMGGVFKVIIFNCGAAAKADIAETPFFISSFFVRLLYCICELHGTPWDKWNTLQVFKNFLFLFPSLLSKYSLKTHNFRFCRLIFIFSSAMLDSSFR